MISKQYIKIFNDFFKNNLVLFVIISFAFLIRTFLLTQKNLWFDEIYSWNLSQESFVDIIKLTSGDIHPPFFYIVLKIWTKFFSDSIESMRMLSTFLSILSMVVIYKLLKKLFDNKSIIYFSLLLFAVSPLNIYYSQEIRMQNLNFFLCLCSVYFFYGFIQNSNFKNGFYYFLFTFLALYTHYFAFLILGTELIIISLKLYRKEIKTEIFEKFFSYFFLINVFYSPWYPVMFQQTSKGQPWRHAQDINNILSNIYSFFEEIFFSYYIRYKDLTLINLSYIFTLILIVVIFIHLLRNLSFLKNLFKDKNINYINYFFFIPLICASFISYKQSILFSRYLSIIVPYLLIILIFTAVNFRNKFLKISLLVFLFGVSTLGVCINFSEDFKINDYRNVISYLEENFNSSDKLIVEPHYMGWFLKYHVRHNENSNLQEPIVYGWNLKMQTDSIKSKSDLKKVWFVLDYSSMENSDYNNLEKIMLGLNFERKIIKEFFVEPQKIVVEYYVRE